MHIVKVEGLGKSYRQVPVVSDLSLVIEQGQVYGLLGPNGSGKTTTLGMVLGIIRPDTGSVSLCGSQNPAQLLAARRRLGGILEQPNFYPFLSGMDNLRIVARIKSLGGRDIPAAELTRTLALVKLTADAHREFRTYSLGMKQRLALAAALLGQPELLILDEPTNGLDPEGMQEIRELIGALAAQGMTIVLSTHLLHEVERVCTHAGIIKGGVLLANCAVSALLPPAHRFRVEAGPVEILLAALRGYGGCVAHVEEGCVIVELPEGDSAALNRFLVERGIYLAALVPLAPSLEQVFLQLTQARGAQA
jgi:ABC-type multidrug transport system ATPase subunit